MDCDLFLRAMCNCKKIARNREKVRGISGTDGDYEKGRE
jgi:hypothetical protein